MIRIFQVNYFTASFHDSVLLLCQALNDSKGKSDGDDLVKKMRNHSFEGISGVVTIDQEGDRIADYSLLDQTDPESGTFQAVLHYYGATQKYDKIGLIHWPNDEKPLDVPPCGFDGTECSGLDLI